jgi:quinol monooxygenase YgiN
MSDVVTVVAKLRAAKGKGDALAALLKEQAGVVRKNEPGCLVYRPHRSTKDPTSVAARRRPTCCPRCRPTSCA